MSKLVVIAAGGNSLIKDEQHKSIPDQYSAAVETSKHIAGIIKQGWDVVLTHGNGPQVGFIQRRSELALSELPPVPLDDCDAASQGDIGYIFQRALDNEFKKRGIQKQVVTVVTQVLVDKNDPAFANPSKPIGSFMDAAGTEQKRQELNWQIIEDAGRGWRRVVPSPLPKKIVELDAIRELIEAGYLVICVGGGGIPVYENESGELVGVEAVIDKDYAGSLLASSIKADLFLISTGVEKVAIHFNKPEQQWLSSMTLIEAKHYLEEGQFLKGSMGPKIQAIIWYLEKGGPEALITNPENLERALSGETGTRIIRGVTGTVF
jgi:carbamate kinase